MEEIKAYKCSKCDKVYLDKSYAEKCCTPKYCTICGRELDSRWYSTICSPCRDEAEYDRATKYTYEEYMSLPEHKDDYLRLYYGDEYYSDIDDLLDSLDDEDEVNELKYVNGVVKDRVELDYESIIIDMEENANIEDFEVDKEGHKELKVFLEQWNKKYGTDSYFCDDKVVVLISDKDKEI